MLWGFLSGNQNPSPPSLYIPFRAGITGIVYSSFYYLPWKICKLSVRCSILYGSILGALELLIKKFAEIRTQPGQPAPSRIEKAFILTLGVFTSFLLSYGISMTIRGHHHRILEGVQLKEHLVLFSTAYLASEAAAFLSLI
ncbi:MAG: hypothetical protein AAF443_07645 [Chlamydiota bacterium]